MLNQKELSKLARGESVNHFLVLRKCELKTSRANKQYLSLEMGDQSLSYPANIWDGFEEFYTRMTIGCVVKVTGVLDEYQGQPQIRIQDIRCAAASDGVSAEEFMPRSRRELKIMVKELRHRIERIRNPYLKELMRLLLDGENFEKYIKAPAGKAWHHSYIHGLLEHTLEIVRICDLMCNIHPEINRDLLICGALMHDFGKIEELTFDSVFDYSDKGKLLGHIVISAIEISKKADTIKGFPEELKNQLIHLVLSHQGKLEFASPVVPKTLESIVLYQADELSAKTNAYKSAIEADAQGNGRWTKYLPLVSTSLYISGDFGKVYEDYNQTLFD